MFRVHTTDDEAAYSGLNGGRHDHQPQEIYADWSAARLLIPLAGLVVVVGIAIVVLLRTVLAPGDVTGDAGPAESTESGQSDEAETVAADPVATAQQRAEAVAQALADGSIHNQPLAYESSPEVAAEFDRITEGLGPHTITAVAGTMMPDGDLRVRGPLNLEWTLSDGTVFSTEGTLRLVQVGPDWQLDWDAAVLHSELTPGDVLVQERVTSPRAAILGADGFELVGQRPVIEVGVTTRNVASIADLTEQLAARLPVDGGEIADRLRRAPSDEVTVVAAVRADDIDPLRAELAALPGVVLTEETATMTPHDGYGRALLGWAGEVTAEILDRSPDYFEVGDIVGRSGLQAVYNERLAGLPGFEVRIDRRFPLRDEAGQEIPPDADVNVVYRSAPQPPEVLQTTIDNRFQLAAEQALAATELTSSLVAVRVSTGDVLAVANGPGAAVENHALTGRYPPGSVFKLVTAYAALEQGFGIDQSVGCPASLVVDGKEFGNAESKDRGTVSFRDAFAHSCNTSFIELGTAMDSAALPRVAAAMGVGVEYELGTLAFAGSVPTPGSAVERAATSFGQGQVLVSPLSMAVMAATVAGGVYRPPTLVVGAGSGEPQGLDPGAVAALREMMTAVVSYGTGQALKGVPGPPVGGKTGTAEFGSGDPPPTHAWFIGYQGDVAFAVVVDGGGFGGSVAAPIAADFLRRAGG